MGFGRRQPLGFSGAERRRASRNEMRRPGYIIIDRDQMIPCNVRDISRTGARLEVASTTSTFGLTQQLALRFNGHRYWAKVVWQTRSSMGVQFL